MKNDYDFFQDFQDWTAGRLVEGPQVMSSPLEAGSVPIQETLRPEQQKLVDACARKIEKLIGHGHGVGEVQKMLEELVVASEKAEGEDASDVEI